MRFAHCGRAPAGCLRRRSDVSTRAGMGRLACLAVLVYVAAVAIRPLNANDLFWHLAAGRHILDTGSIPRTDPFSFASDGGEWIDHEWLWQVGAHALYTVAKAARAGESGEPDPRGDLVLVLAGAAIVLAAFGLALARLHREGAPAVAILVL